MKLIITWDTFQQNIDGFTNEANIIIEKEHSIRTEPEFDLVKAEIKDLNYRSYAFLKTSFDEENNDFAVSFNNAHKGHFTLPNQQKNFTQLKKEAFENFKVKYETLVYFKRIIFISDAILKPDIVNLTDRNSYTTEQTLELILDKLYDLYDNNYHSIPTILEGNGISLKRHGEDRELGKVLEETGYVEITNNRIH